jgi:hypothetical protein
MSTTTTKKKKQHPEQSTAADAAPKVDWSKPTDLDDVHLAFPAQVMGTLLPLEGDIPTTPTLSPWKNLAEQWFFHGLQGSFTVKPHISTRTAARHLRACLGSYEPKQEHKIDGVAYLMSLWFDGFEPDDGTILRFVHVGVDKAGPVAAPASEPPPESAK